MRLRDVLPQIVKDGLLGSKNPVTKLLDKEVLVELTTGWPGKEKHVICWWVLSDGKRVGCNEDRVNGLTFPILPKQTIKRAT